MTSGFIPRLGQRRTTIIRKLDQMATAGGLLTDAMIHDGIIIQSIHDSLGGTTAVFEDVGMSSYRS